MKVDFHSRHYHEEVKKARKKAQAKKNRFHQMMFQHMRMRRIDAQRVAGLSELLKRKPEQDKDKQWSDKVSSVRNRLTGKKRESKERWNRFAGTGDAGGRGL